MKIYRLKVTIEGTKRSIRLDDGKIYLTYIPTWVPNPQQGLYSVEDYMKNIIMTAPLRTGDWIRKLSMESTDVKDDIDLESSESIKSYGSDENENVNWIFESNLIQQFIKNILNP